MNSFDLFGNPVDSSTITAATSDDLPSFSTPLAQMDASVEEEREPARAFIGMWLVVGIIALVLAGQTFNLQIVQGALNRTQAERNSIRLITVPADRGLIVDSTGLVIAQNTRQLALAINPQSLPVRKADRQIVYAQLQKQAGIDNKTITQIESRHAQDPETFSIKRHLSKDEYLLYKEQFANTPGVVVQQEPIRLYSDLPSAGHLLGYVGAADQVDIQQGAALSEKVGKTGLEQTYNSALAGKPGKVKAVVNAQGEEDHRLPGGEDSQAKAGQTLKLSIDSRLQKIVATALSNELARRTKKLGNLPDMGASAVVLDPATGAVKAMVSLPDYNNSLFASGVSEADYSKFLADPAHPLLNRATQAQLAPGSTFKPLMASAGLQAGVITSQTSVTTPERITVGSFSFPDWKYHTGQSDVRRAIAESNDVFFYALGGGAQGIINQGLGIERLDNYIRLFGLGSKTGIDLPGEASGLVGDITWKQKVLGEPWYIGDTYHTSIGQGFTLTTPLQMADSTAAIVNGGTLYSPRLAWSTVDPITGAETLLPHPITRQGFISPQNLQTVREGMRQTVLAGSARPLNTLHVTSAGKTGTAEFSHEGKILTHAWYTGFAPYDNPQLVFAIAIEAGGESFYSSVPVAEEILRGYFNEPLTPGQKLSADTGENLPEYQAEH